MNRFSQPVSKVWMLGGSLLTTWSWVAEPALSADAYFAPHAVHESSPPQQTASPNPFPGAASAGKIPGDQPARPASQQTLVQPAAFQGNGQAPVSNSGSVQQQLDELYRKDGREAPQMNLQQTPLAAPSQASQSRPANLQTIPRPAGSNVVPPKTRSGILSRINPFKSKSNAATQLPPAPPPPPGNQPGYAQPQIRPGQNHGSQQFQQFNHSANQVNNRVNQAQGQLNQASGQIVNQAQQFGNQVGNQARQLNSPGEQFNQRPAMTIQPGQPSNFAPPAAPPVNNNGDELTLPDLPGDESPQTSGQAPPTNFGPKAPKIQKSEPDLLKDVFSDESEPQRPAKPQLQPADVLIDEEPLEQPQQNPPTSAAPLPAREPAASEIDEPLPAQTQFSEDTTLDRLPLPMEALTVDEESSEPAPPAAAKPTAPVDAKSTTTEARDLPLEEKMKIIAERGELRGLKGFCPVGLRDDRDLKNALPEFHSVYKGRTYYFHNADAKTTFDENPQQYAPAASGLDVVLRKSKVLKEGSLDFALWYKDRLYLFTSQKTLEQFMATPKEFVAMD